MRAVARPTPDLAAAARLSASLPYYNAQMRTTCVATRAFGGHAQNALPQLATANVNCASCPAYRPRRVKDTLVKVLCGSEDYRDVCRRRESEQAVTAAPGRDERDRIDHKDSFRG